ncbi:ATP-binding protein [Maribius pontilimi]|uniref:ATP-binding protein n=1 Tax=Palleronia pontilimi TaxID=1964209 RepID=A0A934MCP9_9RHOB|nr:ATP-binding protein [Palleronia pontilimi]
MTVSQEECLSRLSPIPVGDGFRVKSRESVDLEFKRELTLATFRKSLKTVAAFSNCKGGWIVFGVSDRPRNIVGIGAADLDDGQLSEQVIQSISPAPDWSMTYLDIFGLRVAIFEVFQNPRLPTIAIRDLSGGQGEDPLLRQGTVYTRRRGQTSPITGAEFTQMMRMRDDLTEARIFQFLGRGRDIGFDRAIVAGGKGEAQQDAERMTFYIPSSSASDLNIVDRARLIEEDGAPAYEIVGNVNLFAPGDIDPRLPMRAAETAASQLEEIHNIFGNDFPWTFSHLKKAASHLGFWRRTEGDGVNTGVEPLTGTTIYFRAGREEILNFARQNPSEFVDVVASQATRKRWRDAQELVQ